MLSAGIVTSLIDPLAALLSRAAREPIAVYPWSDLAAVLAALVIALRVVDGADWESVALAARSWRARTLYGGAASGAVLILVTAALLALGGWLHFERGDSPLLASGATSWRAYAASALRASAVLAPAALSEELVFRGYFWTVFRDAAGARAALWGTSVLFGVAHWWNPGAGIETTLLVMLAGLALGTVRALTDSLPAAWAAHFAWNFTMAAVLHLPVSGIGLAMPGYRAVISGPEWLTGGAWGPEGGAAAACTMGAALLWIWRRSHWQFGPRISDVHTPTI